MSDRDEGPSSEEPRGPLPMTIFAAGGWTLAAKLLLALAATLLVWVRPGARDDYVSLVGCQAMSWLLVIFIALRVHEPEGSVRDFLGLRSTNWLFIPIAAILAYVIDPPMEAVRELIIRRYPIPPHDPIDIDVSTLGAKISIGLSIAVVGPIVEELLFRGALFRVVKRHDRGQAIFSIAAFFALTHDEPRSWLPLFLLSLAITYLRSLSGSLFPALVFHVVFNLSGLPGLFSDQAEDHSIHWRIVCVSTAVVVALLGIARYSLAPSRSATIAREMDML